jgi:hypothetical protein
MGINAAVGADGQGLGITRSGSITGSSPVKESSFLGREVSIEGEGQQPVGMHGQGMGQQQHQQGQYMPAQDGLGQTGFGLRKSISPQASSREVPSRWQS